MENEVKSLSDLGVMDIPDVDFYEPSEDEAAAMSDEEGFKLHNENRASVGAPTISFEEYKKWLNESSKPDADNHCPVVKNGT